MKIFFVGTVVFSRELLQHLLTVPEAKVVGVATKSRSSVNADHADLSQIASRENIPWKHVKDVNAPHIIEWIKSLNPDVIFCFGWSYLMKSEILNLAPNGVVGYHPAQLPANRGRHPIIWALVLGLEQTASTFFKMDEGADSGDIVSQNVLDITLDDDASSLYNRLLTLAKTQVSEFVKLMDSGNLELIPQDHSKANYWRKRGKSDGEIDFRMNSKNIHNLVRALTRPYAGAHIVYNEKEPKIWKTRLGEHVQQNLEAGKVLQVTNDRAIEVKTADASIWLLEHDIEILPEINTYIL